MALAFPRYCFLVLVVSLAQPWLFAGLPTIADLGDGTKIATIEELVWTVDDAKVLVSMDRFSPDDEFWSVRVRSTDPLVPLDARLRWFVGVVQDDPSVMKYVDNTSLHQEVQTQLRARALSARISVVFRSLPDQGWDVEVRGLTLYTRGERGRDLVDFSFEPALYSWKLGLRPSLTIRRKPMMDMVWVSSGSFQGPFHYNPLELSSFFLGRTEVTQAQYLAVMGTNPSANASLPDSSRRPVDGVSWFDAVAFCNQLSTLEGLGQVYRIQGTTVSMIPGATGYRLPTNAQWEYAARGGREPQGTTYAGSNDYAEVAWYRNNRDYPQPIGAETHPVALKKPNSLGIYDLNGNVWEWTWDLHADAPPPLPRGSKDPTGPSSGRYKSLRGGSILFPEVPLEQSLHEDPTKSEAYFGFRVLRME